MSIDFFGPESVSNWPRGEFVLMGRKASDGKAHYCLAAWTPSYGRAVGYTHYARLPEELPPTESDRRATIIAVAAAQCQFRDETCRRLIDWLRSTPRKPPELAFAAGPERELADEISKAIEREKG